MKLSPLGFHLQSGLMPQILALSRCKKTLADAVIDGVIPQGELASRK
jgi:hypothetical protein